MARPDLTRVVRELHADALEGLDRALGRGTALLLARVGDGEREFLGLSDRPFLTIDATLFPERASIRLELLHRAVARRLGGDPRTILNVLGPDGDRARHTLADIYGPDASHVIALLGRDVPPPEGMRLSLTQALAAVGEDVPLVVFDAHRLDTDARWDIRELERPVLLVTRPDHYDAMTSSDAPFYAHGQAIRLRAPEPADWMRALAHAGQQIQVTDLEWLLDRSRRRVGTTIAGLRLKTPQSSYRTAWRQAVKNTVPRAHELLALARSIHVFAPALLLALAEGRKPYAAIPDAPPARVALALRKLRELDVVEQPEPRASQIADPLIEHALRSLLNSTRMRTALAEIADAG
jgi:hypothetical protein